MRLLVPLVASASLLIAGCSGDDAGPASTVPDTISTTTTTIRPDDGVLRIGVLVPRVGSGAEVGQAVADAFSLAVDEINDLGGVNGRRIEVLVSEESENPTTTSDAIREMIDLGVDAVVGPVSSVNALASLSLLVDAGVVTCSPTASALALNAFPDDGLFFRTIASDSLQALAIADTVSRTGTSTASLAYIDDAYGQPFAERVEAALRTSGITVSTVGFQADEGSIQSAAAAISATSPAVVVILGDTVNGPLMVSAVDEAVDGEPQFVVNGAMRRPSAANAPYGQDLLTRIIGVSPAAFGNDTDFNDAVLARSPDATTAFAAQTYDCVNLIALSAVVAASNRPASIAGSMISTSVNGSRCTRYAECLALIEDGRNIDYDGPAGVLSLGQSGDPNRARFDVFTYDLTGRDVSTGEIVISG